MDAEAERSEVTCSHIDAEAERSEVTWMLKLNGVK